MEVILGNRTLSKTFLEQDVISGGEIIVKIGLQTLLGEIRIDSQSAYLFQNRGFNGNFVITYYQSLGVIVI